MGEVVRRPRLPVVTPVTPPVPLPWGRTSRNKVTQGSRQLAGRLAVES